MDSILKRSKQSFCSFSWINNIRIIYLFDPSRHCLIIRNVEDKSKMSMLFVKITFSRLNVQTNVRVISACAKKGWYLNNYKV